MDGNCGYDAVAHSMAKWDGNATREHRVLANVYPFAGPGLPTTSDALRQLVFDENEMSNDEYTSILGTMKDGDKIVEYELHGMCLRPCRPPPFHRHFPRFVDNEWAFDLTSGTPRLTKEQFCAHGRDFKDVYTDVSHMDRLAKRLNVSGTLASLRVSLVFLTLCSL